jgi:uncharacterized protein YdcH (DUF465 family)
MLILFLIGLLAVVSTIAVIAVAVICGKWLKEYVAKKLKNREKHKVAFADTREVVDDYIKNKAENSEEVSMEELERMCEEKPYVAAVVDEDGEISEYEGFTADEYNDNFKAHMKQQKGMVILGV